MDIEHLLHSLELSKGGKVGLCCPPRKLRSIDYGVLRLSKACISAPLADTQSSLTLAQCALKHCHISNHVRGAWIDFPQFTGECFSAQWHEAPDQAWEAGNISPKQPGPQLKQHCVRAFVMSGSGQPHCFLSLLQSGSFHSGENMLRSSIL